MNKKMFLCGEGGGGSFANKFLFQVFSFFYNWDEGMKKLYEDREKFIFLLPLWL